MVLVGDDVCTNWSSLIPFLSIAMCALQRLAKTMDSSCAELSECASEEKSMGRASAQLVPVTSVIVVPQTVLALIGDDKLEHWKHKYR